MRIAILMATALVMTGCTTAPVSSPVEVTRYRVDDVGRGTIALVSKDGDSQSLEFKAFAGPIADALSKEGYTVLPDGARGVYVAQIAIDTDRRSMRSRSPVSVGLGGSTWSGGGVGLGGGVSFPIGRGRAREQVSTRLTVNIVTREGAGVWEGHAQTLDERPVGTGDATLTATRLANALFAGFPGESGRTIEVK